MLRCKSCDVDTSGFVSKFYGAFNSIMHVVRYKRNEMVAVQLVGSYCLPSMLYGCEVWQTRADDVRSASVAWKIAFGRFLMLAGGKLSDHCYSFAHVYYSSSSYSFIVG